MKKNENIDNELRQMIKDGAYEAAENEWFTRRVLNRLPERKDHSALKMAWIFYMVAAMAALSLEAMIAA